MRRLVPVLTIALLLTVVVSAPAMAKFHDTIVNPYLHILADYGVFAAMVAPVLGAYWLITRRSRVAARQHRATARR